jgi:hypothetical protein
MAQVPVEPAFTPAIFNNSVISSAPKDISQNTFRVMPNDIINGQSIPKAQEKQEELSPYLRSMMIDLDEMFETRPSRE